MHSIAGHHVAVRYRTDSQLLALFSVGVIEKSTRN